MDKIFIFLLCFYFGSAKIKINNLDVPESIEDGSMDDVILDCDFDDDGEKGIVIKWYLNNNEQIYQWIPDTNHPGQALGKLKHIIDVNYKASDDPNTMYRALHITNVSLALTGNYSCKVSSYTSEDVQAKSMIVYKPADSEPTLQIAGGDTSESMIMCTAGGIYPEPYMRLYISNYNETEVYFEEEDEMVEVDEMGLFNVTSALYFSGSNLSSPFTYTCEVGIPGTEYVLKKNHTYYIASGEIETQIEEDYLNLVNATNSTESSFTASQEEAEFETQIEEDLVNDDDNITISTTQTTNSVESTELDDSIGDPQIKLLDESSSSQHPPRTYLLVSLILAACVHIMISL